jgi:archaemetzincin
MRRHVELPQSVADYLRSEPHPITSERRTLVLQPLGHFPFDVVEGEDFVGLVRTPALEELAAVIAAGFGLPVEVLPARPLQPSALASRQRGAITQIDARALLSAVKSDLPPHAYAMLTLVNVDLFAVPEQHYAFGWSLHHGRHGIASFARFDPSFHGGWRPDDLEPTILRRSVRLLGHELAHMFGLTHCNYARCLLGPVDVIEDLDALAVQPCAVCQCKLLRGDRSDRDHECERRGARAPRARR